MTRPRYLVTAALPYSNGGLHVGHLTGAYLPADTYVRYLRAKGEEAAFICGSDDNGVAALIAAQKEGKSVEALTGHYNARQAEDFRKLGIAFDIYGGTHQPDFSEIHSRLSQQFFEVIHEKGYFVKRKSLQLYDKQARRFLPDRYVKGTCYHHRSDGSPCGSMEAYGDQCEACGNLIDPAKLIDPISTLTGSRPELRETVHWYLRLQAFEELLKQWLETKRQPHNEIPAWRDAVLKFSLGQIRQGLPERAMTRDLDWGVPVPLDDPDATGKVLYVWFENLIGYISFTARLCELRGGQWQDYAYWWKSDASRIIHFIGADNIIFHALTWPATLLAEGSHRLPAYVAANSFLNIKRSGEEEKISKSRGSAIWIEEYLKDHDPDPLRYYLTAIAPEERHAAFDMQELVARNNGELVNALGNFIHRTLSFAHQYCESKVPVAGPLEPIDQGFLSAIKEQADSVAKNIEAFRFKAALGEVMALARAGNRYFDAKKPWKQRKEDSLACATTINTCLQAVKALTVLTGPFLPFSAAKCARMLGFNQETLAWSELDTLLPEGKTIEEPKALFKKMDANKE